MIKHLSRISFELDINRQVQLVLYCTSIKTNHEMQLKATEKQLNPELGLFVVLSKINLSKYQLFYLLLFSCECGADLLCDLSHLYLQIIILFSQTSVLLQERLADLCSQLQISLFLFVAKQEEKTQR